MLRRLPTTLQLAQEDVSELIAELEEEKLQLRIQSQRKNLIRSSTRLESGKTDKGNLAEPISVDSSFQISPLDGKRLQLNPSDGPPTATPNWANRQDTNANSGSATAASGSANTEANPFYNREGRM